MQGFECWPCIATHSVSDSEPGATGTLQARLHPSDFGDAGNVGGWFNWQNVLQHSNQIRGSALGKQKRKMQRRVRTIGGVEQQEVEVRPLTPWAFAPFLLIGVIVVR